MAIKDLINGNHTSEIALNDRAVHYGDGLFETIAIQNKQILCFDEHLSRLEKGCKRLKIPIPDKDIIRDEVTSLIDTTGQGVIKIIITRGQGGRGYKIPDDTAPTRIITLFPWPDYHKKFPTTGIKTKVCDFRYARNPALAGIKHLNRLEQILARSEWTDDAISEGIVMDTDGFVIEGTMSNIFCIKNTTLYTPDLSLCGIEGIIREKIIDMADKMKFSVEVKNMTLEFLLSTDEIFICNSLIGVWPVNSIGEKLFSNHEKTIKIANELMKYNFIPNL